VQLLSDQTGPVGDTYSRDVNAAVHIADLWRSYRSTRGFLGVRRVERDALRGVSLRVLEGELFGLLGPNGAGKTTLVKILSTVLLPSRGLAEVFGLDVTRAAPAIRREIGLVFGGERGLYSNLSARETLRFWAAMYRLPTKQITERTDELLGLVGLAHRADDRVETFSRGMKQRLHLARGLIGSPRLLLLDEPTIGLDPVAAAEIRNIVRDLHSSGITIFLTTHYMGEAEALCDRVAFIVDGSIVLVDRPRSLTRIAGELAVVECDVAGPALRELRESLVALGGRVEIDPADTGDVHLRVTGAPDDYAAIVSTWARFNGRRINTREPSLEDVYVRVVGNRGLAV